MEDPSENKNEGTNNINKLNFPYSNEIPNSQKCRRCGKYLLGGDDDMIDPDYSNWISHRQCVMFENNDVGKKNKYPYK